MDERDGQSIGPEQPSQSSIEVPLSSQPEQEAPPARIERPKVNPARAGWTALMAHPLVALAVGIALGIGIGASTVPSKQGSPAAAGQFTPSPIDDTTAAPVEPVEEAPPTYYTPTKADFKLRAKILKKTCFGSAGCNVTYRILVAYSGETLDPDQVWEVTYSVTGGEDGPQINTLTISGGQSSVDQEESLSTSSTRFTIRVVVTDVSLQ